MAEKGKAVPTSLASAIMSPTPSTAKAASNVARIQRNVAEKQRRDKLNGYISELANIVPMVSMSSKRLDKTSILRLSAAHLRISKSVLGGNRKQKKGFKWCPSFLTSDQARDILESVDGFLIVTTSTGKILFTSRSVERYLGHQDIEMIGHSLFIFIHPHDLDLVKDELEKLLLACVENGSGSSRRCSFRCRLKEKAQPRSEVVTYQYVQFVGNMAICDEENDEGMASKSVVNHMFKAFVKLVDVSPYNQLSMEEATADEYVTRHSLDGTIIFADHRLATITGHMPHEVVGLSAYEYIHAGDTSIALFAHHLMFSNDKGTGMIVYRLRTRDDRYVYLKSVGCLQFDKTTKQVDHFVCVNQQLNDSDGDSQLRYFVDRYIPHIKGSSASTLFESVKALQTPGSKSPSTGKVNKTAASNSNGPLKAQNMELKMVTDATGTQVKSQECNTKNSVKNSFNDPSLKDISENNHCIQESQNPSLTNLNDNIIGNIENCNPGSNFSLASGETNGSTLFVKLDHEASEDGAGMSRSNGGASTSKSEYFAVFANGSTTLYESLPNHLPEKVDGDGSISKLVLPSMALDSSYMINKHLNDHAHNNARIITSEGKKVAIHNRNGIVDTLKCAAGNITSFTNVQFQSAGLLQLSKAEISGAKTFNKSDSLGTSEHGSPVGIRQDSIDLSSDNSYSEIQRSCQPLKATDSDSSFESEFPVCNKDPIIGSNIPYGTVDQAVSKHSPFIDHFSYVESPRSKLSLSNSEDSETFCTNLPWQLKNGLKGDFELRDEASSSLMDYCDGSMQTPFDEVNGELKDDSELQEDLSSLLNSTLPPDDSNSLPCANGWNKRYDSTECTREEEVSHSSFM